MDIVFKEELLKQFLGFEFEGVLLFLVEKELPFFSEVNHNTIFFPVYFELSLEQMKLFYQKQLIVFF